jgi:hypothetical protein
MADFFFHISPVTAFLNNFYLSVTEVMEKGGGRGMMIG